MLPLDVSIWRSPLLAVNSWWRACVIDTPRIWSCIHVVGDTHDKERLECWLRRSGNCRLYVTVLDVEIFRRLENLWLDGAMGAAGRIHHLLIDQDSYESAFPFPIFAETPNLHELDAKFWYMGGGGRQFALFRPNTSPPLEALRVRNEWFSPGVIDPKGVDFSSLRSLIVEEELKREAVLDILESARNLKYLEWELYDARDREGEIQFSSKAPIPVLNSMEHLQLRWAHTEIEFFRVVQVPNLHVLSLGGSWGTADELRSILASIAVCHELIYLRIHSGGDHRPSEEDVASLFLALPKLEYMDPGWRDSNIDALRALHNPQQDSAALGRKRSSMTVGARRRLCLPIKYSLDLGYLSNHRLSISLRNLLIATAEPQRHAEESLEGTSGTVDVAEPSKDRFVVVVDVDASTMASVVGEIWSSCGGVSVDSLQFPEKPNL
ncbi:hypothetical protein DL93DRAFT_280407 [Clavulina sp. PMI_390]|nr:hypothetical protein DL93DRAFT_280407 [Clavulina sp. PMI_390]